MKAMLIEVSCASPVIGLSVILLNRSKLTLPVKAMAVYLVIGLIADMKPYLFPASWADPIYKVYIGFEGLFFSWFVHLLSLKKDKRLPWIMTVFSLLVNSLIWFFPEHAEWGAVGETIWFSLLAFVAAWHIVNYTRIPVPVERNGKVWMLFGVFFYFLCAQIVISFYSHQIRDSLWFLHSVINICTNIIYAVGIYLLTRGHYKLT